MKKLLFLLFVQIIAAQSNDLFYHESSNILLTERKANVIGLGLNYNLGYKEVQATYAIDKNFSVFAMYNFNTTTNEKKSLFGDRISNKNNNDGYSFGAGFRKFGKIEAYNTIEILFGYEFQTTQIVSYFSNDAAHATYLDEKYSKIFFLCNLIEIGVRHDSAFSLKTSFFKLVENPFYKGQTTIFFAPSYSYNYKLLSAKNLILTSQIGVSIPTNKFENSYYSQNGISESQSDYIIGGILKFGLQYNFKLKKNENKKS